MSRKALRIASENGKVYFKTLPLGKKRKKTKQEKLKEQDRQFYPKQYYGIKNT
jgi:hypothetical protein